MTGIRDITWEMGPPMPYPTKGQAQGVIGDSIVAAAGVGHVGWDLVNRHGRANGTRLLDTKTQRWESLPDAPVGVRWPEGVAVGDGFYMVTGWITSEPPDTTTRRMFRLSRDGGGWRWDEMPSMRTGRFIPGVAASGTEIVVVGGQASFDVDPIHPDQPGPYVNAVEAFDTADPERGWYDLPPIPGPPRDGVAIATIEDRVYVFGGNYVKYEQMVGGNFHDERRGCGDAYVLDLGEVRWRKLPDAPFPTQGWKAVAYGGRYVVIAGGVRNYPVEHVYEYADSVPDVLAPNFDVLVFDTVEETYTALPTQIPPYVTREPELQDRLRGSEGFDFSKGVYRVGPELDIVGDKIYMCGAEVISNCNVTDEVVVGTIVPRTPEGGGRE